MRARNARPYMVRRRINILRVISGEARGHKLKTLKGSATRPTSDRVKESLFNIVSGYIQGSEVLDLFAGSGSLGIEALSRGAAYAVFADKSKESCGIIKENLAFTKFAEKSEVLFMGFTEALVKLASEGKKFDIVFLDPPYNKNFIQETLKNLAKNDIIRDGGILIAEHHIDDELPEYSGKLKISRKQKYGDTVISFYRGDTPLH